MWTVQLAVAASLYHSNSLRRLTDFAMVRLYFSDSDASTSLTSDVVPGSAPYAAATMPFSFSISGGLSFSRISGIITGTFMLNNTSGATKRYYLARSTVLSVINADTSGSSFSFTEPPSMNIGSAGQSGSSMIAYPVSY